MDVFYLYQFKSESKEMISRSKRGFNESLFCFLIILTHLSLITSGITTSKADRYFHRHWITWLVFGFAKNLWLFKVSPTRCRYSTSVLAYCIHIRLVFSNETNLLLLRITLSYGLLHGIVLYSKQLWKISYSKKHSMPTQSYKNLQSLTIFVLALVEFVRASA